MANDSVSFFVWVILLVYSIARSRLSLPSTVGFHSSPARRKAPATCFIYIFWILCIRFLQIFRSAAQRLINVYDSLQNDTVVVHKKTDSDMVAQSVASEGKSSDLDGSQSSESLRKRPVPARNQIY